MSANSERTSPSRLVLSLAVGAAAGVIATGLALALAARKAREDGRLTLTPGSERAGAARR